MTVRTIAHISDLHFGRHSPVIVEALVACLKISAPDLVVVSGDLTQRARQAEFAEARAFLERLPFPLLVIPGNHDIPLYDTLARWFRPFAKYRRFIAAAGLGEALFVDKEIAALGVNTVRRLTGKNGRVSLGQVAELGRAFREAAPSLFKILVSHHPLGFPDDMAPSDLVGHAKFAWQAMSAAGVQLILSGHYHRSGSGGIDAEKADGGRILVVHAGTAVSSRTRHGDGNSFNLIHIDLPVLTVKVMAYGERGAFIERSIATYRLEDGRWRDQRSAAPSKP